jgi:ribosomal protein L40E
MPSLEKLNANRQMFTELLLEQAQPYLTAQPKVFAKTFGESVTFRDTMGNAAKAMFLPFGKNEMRTDCRVFVELPSAIGDVFAVLHFSGFAMQPVDYLFQLKQNLPHAAFLKKSEGLQLNDKWASALTESGENDPFTTFLDGLEQKEGFLPDKPHYHANWVYHLGKMAVEVPYTMALIPLGDSRSIFLFKYNYRPGLFSVKKSKFDLDVVWRIATWINDALADYGYDGPPAALEVPVAAASLLAIPEIAPLFTYRGEDLSISVSLPDIEKAKSIPQPISDENPVENSNSAEKFCIKCGQKMPLKAAFCSKCGTKQA